MDDKGAAPLQRKLADPAADTMQSESESSEWSSISTDLLSSMIWSTEYDSDLVTLHPSTWPEEVALPRFPPDRPPPDPAPSDDDDDDENGFEDIMPYGDRQSHRHFRVEAIWKTKRYRSKILSPRPREFGERPLFREELPKFVDPETVILWPEWMLTETGFQGFRIIGRLPVIFHESIPGSISKRNRQFFIDIADKPNAVVKEPRSSDINEGAVTFSGIDLGIDGENISGHPVAEDFISTAFIPWNTCLV